MKLFTTKQVQKFFNILDKLERGYSINPLKNIYKGYDKKNPDISYCQRQVFVNRTLNKWLKDKYLILYTESEQTSVEYKQYVSISKIRYGLNWRTELEIIIYDYSKPYDIWTSLIIDHNKALSLEGEWCKDNKIHNHLLEHFVLNIPEKEFKFKSWDISKLPKRKKKGQSIDDVYDMIQSSISIYAKTEKEAYKKIEKLRKTNDKIIYGELINK